MPNAIKDIVRAAFNLIGADGILRRPGTGPEDLAIVKNVGSGGGGAGLPAGGSANQYLAGDVSWKLLTASNVAGLGTIATHNVSEFDAAGLAATVQTNLTAHVNNTNNPHNVTAAQLSVYTANQVDVLTAGLQANLNSHMADHGNPHAVTAVQAGAEPTIAGGNNTQYWRGDKSWQVLNAAAVGLSNVTNLSFASSITGIYNPMHYGAAGDDTADDTAAVLNAYNAIPTNGGRLYFPPGKSFKTTGGFVFSKPIVIEGAASSNGRSGTPASIVKCTSASSTLFTLTNPLAMVRDIDLLNTAVGTPGSNCHGLYFNSADVAARPMIHNVTVERFYNNVDVNVGTSGVIDGLYSLGPINYGIRIDNALNKDWGDCTIVNSWFWSNGSASPAAIKWEGGGGLRILNNKVVDYKGHGIWAYVGHGVTTGQLFIEGNSIDEVHSNGIRIESADATSQFNYVTISGNEIFAQDAGFEPIYIGPGADSTLSGFVIDNNTLVGVSCVGKAAITFANNHAVVAKVGRNNYFGGVCPGLYSAGASDSIDDGTSLPWLNVSGNGTVGGQIHFTTVGTNTAGSVGNQTIKAYYDGSPNSYGWGVSAFNLEYQVPTGAAHSFYVAGALVGAFGAAGFSSPDGATFSTGSIPWQVSGSNVGGYVGVWSGNNTGTNASGTNFSFLANTAGTITIVNSGGTVNLRVANNDVGVFNASGFTLTGTLSTGTYAATVGALTAVSGNFSGTMAATTGTFSGTVTTTGITNSGNSSAKQFQQTQQTLTDAATITWNANSGGCASVTLGGNRTLQNPTNLQTGATYLLIVKQDATGSRTLSYDTLYSWPGGSAPTLTTTANAVDLLTFYYDGTKLRGTSLKAFA